MLKSFVKFYEQNCLKKVCKKLHLKVLCGDVC